MSVSYIARRASQEALRQMSFVFNTIFLVPARTESVPRLFFLTGISKYHIPKNSTIHWIL